ncbi:hypothetical protein ACU686_31165 [Yinghuangia aomiensis]
MAATDLTTTQPAADAELFDPTVAAPPVVDVAEYGFPKGASTRSPKTGRPTPASWEYSKAANPIGAGLTTEVPAVAFPAALHGGGGDPGGPARPVRTAAHRGRPRRRARRCWPTSCGSTAATGSRSTSTRPRSCTT